MLNRNKIFEIHRLKHQGVSNRQISQDLGISRETVSRYLSDPDRHPVRRKRSSKLDHYKAYIDGILEVHPRVPAEIILSRLRECGYPGEVTIVRNYLRSKRRKCSVGNEFITFDDYMSPSGWLLMLLQCKISVIKLKQEFGEILSGEEIKALFDHIHDGELRERNRSISVLGHLRGLSSYQISRFLMIGRGTVSGYIDKYSKGGINHLFSFSRTYPKKHDQLQYKEALFAILHSPPNSHGINRTSWTMQDLHEVMRNNGLQINSDSLRQIIKDSGFRFRKAKKVLTSTDPEYHNKLQAITGILSNLSEVERFFSIDEFGPVSIRTRGGKALTAPGEHRVIPQIQKSKGSLMLVGALELSTNQLTHFYAEHKNTAEMIKLLHLLLEQYKDQDRIYLSWDAASWHGSKSFMSEVERVNTEGYRKENKTPIVLLAPLPSCAQFLNVIESIFSGMARAIIHNSDYQSVEECMDCIDRYILKRNKHFKENPKRAGNKIWGKERVTPVFKESNNCKDPLYR